MKMATTMKLKIDHYFKRMLLGLYDSSRSLHNPSTDKVEAGSQPLHSAGMQGRSLTVNDEAASLVEKTAGSRNSPV